MLKFFCWLLVPLLPLTGFSAGLWLMPEKTPRWQTSFPNKIIRGLGFVNEGGTLLLAETFIDDPVKKTISNNIVGLIGLDAQTGTQLFRTSLPDEVLKGEGSFIQNARLTDDDSTILLTNTVRGIVPQTTYNQVLLYDWQQHQITRRYRSNYRNGAINRPILRGNTLLAMGAAADNPNLILWHEANGQPAVIPMDKAFFDAGLSPDGKLAYVRQSYRAPYLLLIDVKKNAVIQTIEGIFHEVHWSPDHQSFLGVEYDLKKKVILARRYQFIDNH